MRALGIFSSITLLLVCQGLTAIKAPGEAEATCAALNVRGLVDGVMTTDSDTLLFGAEKVYKSLKLMVDNMNDCEVEVFEMEAMRKRLGLVRGGSKALIAIGGLIGGDYNMKGAKVYNMKGAKVHVDMLSL